MKIYKKCIEKLFSFLFNETTLPSDDPLRLRKNLLEWIYNKSWQLIIKRLTGLRNVTFCTIIIEKSKLNYSPLEKAFKEQKKLLKTTEINKLAL